MLSENRWGITIIHIIKYCVKLHTWFLYHCDDDLEMHLDSWLIDFSRHHLHSPPLRRIHSRANQAFQNRQLIQVSLLNTENNDGIVGNGQLSSMNAYSDDTCDRALWPLSHPQKRHHDDPLRGFSGCAGGSRYGPGLCSCGLSFMYRWEWVGSFLSLTVTITVP
jgi:hypothetical protein